MHTATFFITTARSGTQWVSRSLKTLYLDRLVVEHEPVKYAYCPKRCLRDPGALEKLRSDPVVRAHLDAIHAILQHRSYVEVGFPAFALAPLLLEEFGSRLRLVQLVRHPVRVGASIVTQRWFDPGRRPDIEADIALTPDVPGVCMSHYSDSWRTLTPFQKALFNWAEVHLYGLEVRGALAAVPSLQVSFEDLLTRRDAAEEFLDFLAVPMSSGWKEVAATPIDRHRNKTTSNIDPSETRAIPEIARLAGHFGYNLDTVSRRTVNSRYRVSIVDRVRRHAKRAVARFAEPLPYQALSKVRRGQF